VDPEKGDCSSSSRPLWPGKRCRVGHKYLALFGLVGHVEPCSTYTFAPPYTFGSNTFLYTFLLQDSHTLTPLKHHPSEHTPPRQKDAKRHDKERPSQPARERNNGTCTHTRNKIMCTPTRNRQTCTDTQERYKLHLREREPSALKMPRGTALFAMPRDRISPNDLPSKC